MTSSFLSPGALSLAEARAILFADEALELSYEERLNSGRTLGLESREAWARLVQSARDRIAIHEEQRGNP